MSAGVAFDGRRLEAGTSAFEERVEDAWSNLALVSLPGAVRVLGPFVDGLELSWQPLGEELRRRGRRDGLDHALLELRTGGGHALPPFATNGRRETVALGPDCFRGSPFHLRCASWEAGIHFSGVPRPRAFFQMRAAYLAEVGPLRAYEDVRRWVDERLLPLVDARAASPIWRVSRLDAAVDLLGVEFGADDIGLFTTRARKRRDYEHRSFTGFTFGHGGSLEHRLYLKSAQASPDDPALARLRAAGWDPAADGPVWRSEYQVRSKKLREWTDKVGFASLEPDAVLGAWPALWPKLVKWLVLRDKSARRSRIERTPVAPWWTALADLVPISEPTCPKISPRRRSPNVDHLESQLLGFIVKYAAMNGATTFDEILAALGGLLRKRLPEDAFKERVGSRREEMGLDEYAAAEEDEIAEPMPAAADGRAGTVAVRIAETGLPRRPSGRQRAPWRGGRHAPRPHARARSPPKTRARSPTRATPSSHRPTIGLPYVRPRSAHDLRRGRPAAGSSPVVEARPVNLRLPQR